jgi:serine/arginine repetitive matrix protein 2
MLQRENSNSSHGSADRPPSRGMGGGVLQRRDSSGSMTERTFRSPSPNRPGSRGGVEQPPPVPRVPDSYNAQHFPLPDKAHRRAASMEPPPRVMSPTSNIPGGRGVSLDRRPGQLPGQPPGQTAKQRVSSLDSVQELERTNSRNSINFSYPTHARPNSPTPPASPISPTFGPVNTKTRPVSLPAPPKPAPALSPAETASVQYSVTEAANKSIKKKKKAVARQVAEGSHLSSGATGGKPTGTEVGASPAQIAAMAAPALQQKVEPAGPSQPVEVPKKPKRKKSKPKVTEPQSQDYQPGHVRYGSESDSASERESQPAVRSARASGQLQKQPSIVREDWEGEAEAELNQGPPRKTRPHKAENPVSATASTPRPKKTRPAAADPPKKFAETSPQPQPQVVSQPPPTLITTVPSPELPSGSRITHNNNHLAAAKQNGNGQVVRTASLSPSRQAHFSNYVLIEDSNEPKHRPPPRSVSPVKSAMKHHSPSPQALSPVDIMPGSWNRGPPSEASDGTSVVSDEGPKAVPKKKKSVRVSFDDDAVVVGAVSSHAAIPPVPPVQEEVKLKEPTNRPWFSSSRGKSSEDFEDGIKPIPALPSFGSIRGKRIAASDQSTPLSSEDNSSTASSISGQATQDNSLSISSDHAIGGILAQDFASKPQKKPALKIPSNEPLPPEVTSVEGTGYGSDTDGSIYSVENEAVVVENPATPGDSHIEEDHAAPYRELPSPIPDSDNESLPQQKQEVETVPTIAVHPATPSSEHEEKSEGQLTMPGGFPVSTETLDKALSDTERSNTPGPIVVTPATAGITEPTPPGAAIHQDPSSPSVGAVAQGLGIQTADQESDSDDTGDSIYSDAAEDVSDLEGDGFGSINAIVESPVSPAVQSPSLPSSSPADSPAAKSVPTKSGPKGISDPVSQEGWDKAQEHWNNINQSRKDGKQVATVPAAPTTPVQLSAPPPKPKKKKKTVLLANADPSLPSTQTARAAPSSSKAPPKSALKQSGPPTMRRSMRSEPIEEEEPTHMRQSMRTTGTMRGSMRGAPSPRKQRHSIDGAPMPAPEPKGTLQKRNLRPVSEMAPYSSATAFKQPATPKPSTVTTAPSNSSPSVPKKTTSLRRTFSNDSDSSSSFKKSRPVKPSGEKYTMRRSMRSISAGPQPLSPVVERYPRVKRDSSAGTKPSSQSGGFGMRSTMRGSIDSTPSLRNKDRPTSPSSFNFGRKSKEKAKPTKSPSRFKSRFGDSSDEDEGPRIFRSRYADSSDDEPLEMPKNLRPVRGIPRKQNEGDSTDLDDSSDDEAPPQRNQTSPKPSGTQGSTLATGSLRPQGPIRDLETDTAEQKKKKGFLNRFRTKKEKSKPNSLPIGASEPPIPLQSLSPSNYQAQSPNPKLQRRVTPKRFGSESWPLPNNNVDDKRPSTSDGIVTGTDVRVGFAGDLNNAGIDSGTPTNGRVRTNTDSTTGTGKVGDMIVGRRGKKKRFPMLRKAFGLND